jgi:uncharacterized protein (DUF2236 family)
VSYHERRAGPAQGPAAEEMLARVAAAFVAGVPAVPEDDGYFGPCGVTWRLTGDISAPIAGMRSLLMQALHPLAMAAIEQHSNWRVDPVARLVATVTYVTTVTFGDRAMVDRAAASVRRIHAHVHGVDEVTRSRYAADDPDLLLWVHAVFVESALAAAELLGSPVSRADRDRYVAEMAAFASLVGVPADRAPTTLASLDAFLDSLRPKLVCTPPARELMTYLLVPPGPGDDVDVAWSDLRDAALAAMPAWALELYGYPSTPLSDERRHQLRQSLGLLDVLFLGQPGVLEARQRIALRIRRARC